MLKTLRAWKSPALPPLTIQGYIKKIWPYDAPMDEWIPDAPKYCVRPTESDDAKVRTALYP